MSIQPLFVFDGPHKPSFKRGKRVGANGGTLPGILTKQLLKFFGFPFHNAPGEAEAECALLQREGIVDAVLSEDVDTLMFGSGLTMRDWSSDGPRGNNAPTHISLYDSKVTYETAGLDREGMILIALMSGGDYIAEGIPGCGIKVACEAARAGFGKSLCRISRTDYASLQSWRQGLAHEIQTNESKYFRVKHKALKIPENFPNQEVLGYYTHPVVSSSSKVSSLRNDLMWDGDVDVAGLRRFVAEAFEWVNRAGATKFVRTLAPALLVAKLRIRGNRRASGLGDLLLTSLNERDLVSAICGQRIHHSTDGIGELRLIYVPNRIVSIDLDAEHDESEDYGRTGLAPDGFDESNDGRGSEDEIATRSRSVSPSKRAAPTYDPTVPEKLWIPESIAKLGVPLMVEDYEEALRNPQKLLAAKELAKKAATKRITAKKSGMPNGAMDRFVKISKPGIPLSTELPKAGRTSTVLPHLDLPPVFLAPGLDRDALGRPSMLLPSARKDSIQKTKVAQAKKSDLASTKPRKGSATCRNRNSQAETPDKSSNPWSLAKKPACQPISVSLMSDEPDIPSEVSPMMQSNELSIYKEVSKNVIVSPLSSPPTIMDEKRASQEAPLLAPANKATLEKRRQARDEMLEHRHFQAYKTYHTSGSMSPSSMPKSSSAIPFEDIGGSASTRQSRETQDSLEEEIYYMVADDNEEDLPELFSQPRPDVMNQSTPPSRSRRPSSPVAPSSPDLPPLSEFVSPRRRRKPTKKHVVRPTAIDILISPSHTTLLQEEEQEAGGGDVIDEARQIVAPPIMQTKMKRRFVAPRDSLPGAWIEVDEVEARLRGRVYENVDVVDMTGD